MGGRSGFEIADLEEPERGGGDDPVVDRRCSARRRRPSDVPRRCVTFFSGRGGEGRAALVNRACSACRARRVPAPGEELLREHDDAVGEEPDGVVSFARREGEGRFDSASRGGEERRVLGRVACPDHVGKGVDPEGSFERAVHGESAVSPP